MAHIEPEKCGNLKPKSSTWVMWILQRLATLPGTTIAKERTMNPHCQPDSAYREARINQLCAEIDAAIAEAQQAIAKASVLRMAPVDGASLSDIDASVQPGLRPCRP
jgi:hypothetical protein